MPALQVRDLDGSGAEEARGSAIHFLLLAASMPALREGYLVADLARVIQLYLVRSSPQCYIHLQVYNTGQLYKQVRV